jgi:hypothetical protein
MPRSLKWFLLFRSLTKILYALLISFHKSSFKLFQPSGKNSWTQLCNRKHLCLDFFTSKTIHSNTECYWHLLFKIPLLPKLPNIP